MTPTHSPDDTRQLVVVANRLPVDLARPELLSHPEDYPDASPSDAWKRSPGGLVTALEPLLQARGGVWVGWPGIADAAPEPFTLEGVDIRPVPLSTAEVDGFYEGFSNGTLWPLYHDVIVPPEYHREWWQTYQEVNRRFAAATAEAADEGALVWVQDYQLQLVPRMLRDLRPDLKIGFFLHIPFPPLELFLQLPWCQEIIDGLLGADLVGFHLPGGAQNFQRLAQRLGGHSVTSTSRTVAGAKRRVGTITLADEDRQVLTSHFPISIDSQGLNDQASTPDIKDAAKKLRASLGNPEVLFLGVDRLDYTKGIDLRLRALGELFDEGRLDPAKVHMVQLATPSRERVDQYKKMRDRIELTVTRINGEHGQLNRQPITYLHHAVPRTELLGAFAAADVMVVTPLRDGMNLVAKEYVACRSGAPRGRSGALVLSEFTGAARELHQAYLCNPHDTEGVKQALVDAATDADGRRAARMRALRRQVLKYDVAYWSRSFLDLLTDLEGDD